MVHGLSGEGGGRGPGKTLSWKERDPIKHSLVSRASARVGWVLVRRRPWKLGMGRAVRRYGAADSKDDRTRKATLHL